MMEEVWNGVRKDPAAKDYSFKNIGLPSPDAGSISKCRELCAQNLCGSYNTTWGCPPGIGSEGECLKAVGRFSKAAILIRKFENVDLNDRELLKKLGAEHHEVCRKFANALRKEGYEVLPMADGGCQYCGECTYPGGPCRFPDQLVPSISCYGILMEDYMRSQGIDFSFKKDGITLYGLIMYNEP